MASEKVSKLLHVSSFIVSDIALLGYMDKDVGSNKKTFDDLDTSVIEIFTRETE